MHFTLALGVGGRIAALEEVVVQFVDPAGAGLSHLAFVRGERRAKKYPPTKIAVAESFM